MTIRDMQLVATTDAAGAATVNGEKSILGRLLAIEWVIGTCDAGVDVTVSIQTRPGGVAQTLLTLTDANASAIYYPRVVVHGGTGTALTGTAGGDTIPPLVVGTPRVVIAQGGNVKTGRVILYYET